MPNEPKEPIELPWSDLVTVVLLFILSPAALMLCWAIAKYIAGGGF